MTSDAIDFWFSTGSTYICLTVSRLPVFAAAKGVRFNWRPFSVRAIMREQNDSPFAGKPVKSAYMRRDIERRAAMHGLRANVPAAYPLKAFDLANRLAIPGLAEVGQEPARCVERADGGDISALYDGATQEAKMLGFFGSPTFAARGELFRGDDRLDDALSWFRHGRLSS